ncbi:SDR family NAD(P)-dependent oxidoreductase [Salibacterium halotolerans]|uniref:NAD(P)-dependent dehydrogenase, short-chain alcohol dehydrogenase family n=1 Tax=Salibacterium halotolerans TaxID=1884432 RepID=A0A1I5PM86_9BACI|nr:glucose 1-dehydrogenase [Salibacterium halotolerans]SFP34910.1 NAD(P)-dependent dehydrogenase, short-chain alcohol dehydrogenase family [Salibacterium halotolerans]
MSVYDLFHLEGKTALVTGGARGLGKSIAKALSEAGARIIITDIHVEEARQAVQEMTPASEQHFALEMNVTDEESVQSTINQITEEYGGIHILVNNAGTVQKKPTIEMSLKEWQTTMNVNVDGVFLTSKFVAEHMMNRGGGTIINMASMSSFISNTEAQSAYNASKGAVHTMTKCFALEWADDSIRVNAIAPGYMETDMTKPIFQPGGELAHVLDYVPMKRLGKPEELGGMAVYLASDASSFVTGSTFVIDGGYTIW